MAFRVTDPFRWLEDQYSPRTREWLDYSMSMRVLISTASQAATEFGIGFVNWWTLKPMIRSRRLGGDTSSGNGSPDRNSSAFISARALTDQISWSSILPSAARDHTRRLNPLECLRMADFCFTK